MENAKFIDIDTYYQIQRKKWLEMTNARPNEMVKDASNFIKAQTTAFYCQNSQPKNYERIRQAVIITGNLVYDLYTNDPGEDDFKNGLKEINQATIGMMFYVLKHKHTPEEVVKNLSFWHALELVENRMGIEHRKPTQEEIDMALTIFSASSNYNKSVAKNIKEHMTIPDGNLSISNEVLTMASLANFTWQSREPHYHLWLKEQTGNSDRLGESLTSFDRMIKLNYEKGAKILRDRPKLGGVIRAGFVVWKDLKQYL